MMASELRNSLDRLTFDRQNPLMLVFRCSCGLGFTHDVPRQRHPNDAVMAILSIASQVTPVPALIDLSTGTKFHEQFFDGFCSCFVATNQLKLAHHKFIRGSDWPDEPVRLGVNGEKTGKKRQRRD
jgi:hypothetical protein